MPQRKVEPVGRGPSSGSSRKCPYCHGTGLHPTVLKEALRDRFQLARARRRALGIGVTELAKELGIVPGTIWAWDAGRAAPIDMIDRYEEKIDELKLRWNLKVVD